MTIDSATDSADSVDETDWLHSTLLARVKLLSAVALSVLLFDWMSRTFAMPDEPGFTASLLQQPGWFLGFLAIALGTAIVMLAAGTLVRWPRTDVPVLCAAAGMGVLSWRGGSMQSTLFTANGPSVFIALAVETLLLFAALVGAWMLLQTVVKTIHGVEDHTSETPETWDEKLLGAFAHAALMTTLMVLLSRTDSKTQSMACVGIASCFAAIGGYQIVHVRSSFWFWISPLAVAILGYVFTSFHAETWQNGVLHGAIATLARPLPLDYVSMGPIGAIIGYSMAGGGEDAGEQQLEPLPDAAASG